MTRVSVLHEDDELLVVDKPSGLVCHASAWSGTRAADALVGIVRAGRGNAGERLHLSHRLDRGTSGVLLFGRSPEVARRLEQLFASGSVVKRYVAAVRGLPPEALDVDHPVPRGEGKARAPATTSFSRRSHVTITSSALREKRYGLVEATPRTGRFHQIRRHLAHAAHPVLGDANYGRGEHNRFVAERFGLRRLALHASSIELLHPGTGAVVRFEAPMPDDLREPLERMGLWPCARAEDAAQDPSEPFDLVDEGGRPLGKSKPRADVHRDGDWHRSIHVWVVLRRPGEPDRVVLQRRSRAKDTWPGRLDVAVTGHLRAGETDEEALREADEEIGLALDPSRVRRLALRVRPSRPAPEIVDNEVQTIFCAFVGAALEDLRPAAAEVEGVLAIVLDDALALVSGERDSVRADELEASSSRVREVMVTLDQLVPDPDGYYRRSLEALARARPA